MKLRILLLLIFSLVFSISQSSAMANHNGKSPWKKRWSSIEMERLAKTVWCIQHGYSDYRKNADNCKK